MQGSRPRKCRFVGRYRSREMTLKIAVIGAGYTAREHVRAFNDIPEVSVTGIHSRSRHRAEMLASEMGVSVVADSIDELYERTTAELVVVTVPELPMRDVVSRCFRWPWAVMMEKPPGYNLRTALDIADAAEAAGSDALVALNRRHLSATRAVLGDLQQSKGWRFIKVQDQQDQAAARAAGQPELVVRNWMYANSIHTIDYFTFMGRGTVDEIEHVSEWEPDEPGVVIARLHFSSRDVGLYEGIWSGPGPWAVSVTTSDQRWEMRPLEEATTQRRGESTVERYEKHPRDETFKPGFRAQAEAAIRYVRGGASEAVTLREALRTMRLISQIFQMD